MEKTDKQLRMKDIQNISRDINQKTNTTPSVPVE